MTQMEKRHGLKKVKTYEIQLPVEMMDEIKERRRQTGRYLSFQIYHMLSLGNAVYSDLFGETQNQVRRMIHFERESLTYRQGPEVRLKEIFATEKRLDELEAAVDRALLEAVQRSSEVRGPIVERATILPFEKV